MSYITKEYIRSHELVPALPQPLPIAFFLPVDCSLNLALLSASVMRKNWFIHLMFSESDLVESPGNSLQYTVMSSVLIGVHQL